MATNPRPLAGMRIGVTRPPHKARSFAARLRELGAEPVIMPTITIAPPEDTTPLDDALSRLPIFDWLLFTSANAVRYTFNRFDYPPKLPKIGVVGAATAVAVENEGAPIALIAEEQSAAGLFDALYKTRDLTGMRALIPQSAIARPELRDLLTGAGAIVETPTAYRTLAPDISAGAVADLHAITFTSPSTVENFAESADLPPTVRVFAIGPTTSAACEALGWGVAGVAQPHSIEGLTAALVAYYE